MQQRQPIATKTKAATNLAILCIMHDLNVSCIIYGWPKNMDAIMVMSCFCFSNN